jgi:hypothetical protein
MKRFIGYHFFHGVGRIPPDDAYYRTQNAMGKYSDQKVPSRRTMLLDLRDDPEDSPLEPLFKELCRKYGPVSDTSRGIPQSGPEYRAHRWDLNGEQVEEALSSLEMVYREIPASRNRAHVQAFWTFKFIEPETGALLPDQADMPQIDMRLGGGSSLGLATGSKTSVNAWFLFPFESASTEFEHYACELQKDMIFKFSPKYWRLWNHYPKRGWWPRKFVPSWY